MGSKWLVVVLAIATVMPMVPLPAAADGSGTPGTHAPKPVVVIAHIDAGINPYHPEFRDDSPLAQRHPCEYLDGYPCSAEALHLSLDESTFEAAFEKDLAIWEGLFAQWSNASTQASLRGKLFWIPGTKIVGALRFSPGGQSCQISSIPTVVGVNRPQDPTNPNWILRPNNTSQPVIINPGGNPTSIGPNGVVWSSFFPIGVLAGPFGCRDYPILDEHGHGTMTATRMGGNTGSLCPTCRVVSIEGLGGVSTRWAAAQGWIDVQTNSWLNLVPPPANHRVSETGPNGTTKAFAYAQDKMLVYAASGNGAGYVNGFAPTPTWVLSTAAPGVILVGAHDNGYVAAWSGTPAHVVADGYGGNRAEHKGLGFGPHPIACCTSAASPYAAGGGAQIVLEARKLLNDKGVGVRDVGGVAAIAVNTDKAGHFSGPLSDGILDLDEAKELVKKSAEALPREGANDGIIHWTTAGPQSESASYIPLYGPAANPFCNGCWTTPVKWADSQPYPCVQVEGATCSPAFASIGYGGVNERAVALAVDVLTGDAALPDRSDVDAYFEVEGVVRAPFFDGS